MYKRIIFSFIVIVTSITFKTNAQKSIADSTIFTSMIVPHVQFQLPGGDLAERFKYNTNIGGSLLFKTSKNWIIGVEGSFLFGNKVKEDNILDIISTEQGFVIDGSGMYADIRMFERGFSAYGKLGKVFPLFGPNPNSGLVAIAGFGFLQHKIRIEVNGNSAPQLKDDYKKGYDRLTNGFSTSQFIGYMHFSNRKLINFYAGIEVSESFTKNRRSFNFDQMKKDETNRIDLLYGVKFGWIFRLYREPKSFYYN